MSFLATLGILCLSYPLTEQCVSYFHGRISRACVRYLGGMLVSTFAANLFLFPVYILQLHSFAPAGLLVNFLFLPLSTVLLYTAPFVLLLYPVPVLGHAAASLCRTIAALFLHLVDSLDASIGLAVPMDLPFVPYLCTLLVCASVLYCLRFRPGIGLILIFAACCGLYLLCTVLSAV